MAEQNFRCPRCNAIVIVTKTAYVDGELRCHVCGAELFNGRSDKKSTVPWTTRQPSSDIVTKQR